MAGYYVMPHIPLYIDNGSNSGSIARGGRGRVLGYFQAAIKSLRSILVIFSGADV